MVQDLMDRKEIEFSNLEDSSVNVITGTMYSGTPSSTGPRLITIFHDNEAAIVEVPRVPTPVLLVEVPKPFPYTSRKAIPWNYNCNYTHQTDVNDLTGVGGLTWSGRCYALGLAEEVIPKSCPVPINAKALHITVKCRSYTLPELFLIMGHPSMSCHVYIVEAPN